MADLAQIGVKFDTSDLREGKAAIEALAPAAKNAENAVTKLETATGAASAASGKLSTATGQVTTATNSTKAAVTAAAGAMDKETAAAQRLAAGLRAADAANDNLAASTNAAKGQIGLYTAQLNDIGVQLAGGQSPWLIGLQQVSQLNLGAMGLRATLATVGGAFLSVLSPVNLLAIAIVGLGGTVVQYFAEWISSGQQANLTIEEQAAVIQRVTEAWGAAFPAIQQYNNELQRQKDIQDLMAAAQVTNEQHLEKIRTAFAEIAPEAERFISQLSFENLDNSKIIDLQTKFETLQEKVASGKQTQEDFNAVLEAAQAAAASGVSGLEGFISMLGSLIANVRPAVAAVNALNQAVANAASNQNNPAMWRSAGMTGQSADGPIQGSSMYPQLPATGPTPEGRGTPELSGFPWDKIGGSSSKGGGGAASKTITELQKLQQEFTKLAEPFNQAKSAYSTLKTAMDNGIITNDAYTSSLKEIEAAFIAAGGTSQQWAKITEETGKKTNDSMSQLRDVTKGFVSDLRSGLKNGESFFEAFANAGLNAADKLIDKGLNAIIDKLFEVNSTASSVGTGGGSGGGILGWISKGITALFSAKGNVFANGGAFTNSIVDKPTAFAFGKGGSNLGIMGEAGPEAVIPLKRGPNGSLGVQLHGANGGQKQAVNNNVAVNNVYRIEGAVSEKTLVAQIQATAEKTKDDTKKEMVGWLNEYQRNGYMSSAN